MDLTGEEARMQAEIHRRLTTGPVQVWRDESPLPVTGEFGKILERKPTSELPDADPVDCEPGRLGLEKRKEPGDGAGDNLDGAGVPECVEVLLTAIREKATAEDEQDGEASADVDASGLSVHVDVPE